MRLLFVLTFALVAMAGTAAAASISIPLSMFRQPLFTPLAVGMKQASIYNHYNSASASTTTSSVTNSVITDDFLIRGGAKSKSTSKSRTKYNKRKSVADASASACCSGTPCSKFLSWAYAATGLATTAAWSTMVYTTIRSNQPVGAMMPCWQHGFFARIGAMSAAPLILNSFASLAHSVSRADSWEDLSSDTNPSFNRHNLALAVAGVGSALWVGFAPIVTKIPGTVPLLSHQNYAATPWIRAALIGAYGSGAALSMAVWARSLPDTIRANPFKWPGRIADGVSKSLVCLAPKDVDNPVQVKYALLTGTFLAFTGMGTLCNMPIAVIPSWTSRRLSRAFPLWMLLAAVNCFDLKEAAENGTLGSEDKYGYLSSGVKGFGQLYLGARAGCVAFDPSFPEAFHVINGVPGLAVAAIVAIGLTQRSDE